MIIFYACFLLFVAGLIFLSLHLIKSYHNDQINNSNFSKQKIFDFLVLVLRWYLAYYMIEYGWDKMTGAQFGHRSAEILNTPLKDVDKFNLAWQLFSLDKTFNIALGLTQILGGILIVINRTALVGALVLLPILAQIFLVDLAFTTGVFGSALPIRLLGMISADLLILFNYKDRMILVWNTLTNGTTTRFKYKWWMFLFLPLLGMFSDFAIGLITLPIKLLLDFLTK